MKIRVRFSAKSLAGANAGVDLDASSLRYAEALSNAIAADFGGSTIDVARDDASSLVVRVEDADEKRAREAERTVTDLAWVVKQCAPWSIPAR